MTAQWRDRWIVWRNRWLASPRFQRWAAAFPMTRQIARQRTQDLFDLVAGFVYSQTLAACIRLGLLERLAAGPAVTRTLAEDTALSEASLERLLAAGATLGLVSRAGPSRWALGPQGATLLGNPGLVRMVEHHVHLYADLADCVGLLRREGGGGELARYWPYATATLPADADADRVRAYSELMNASQPGVAADVLDAYPVARHRRLLDVGGGQGAFLTAAGARAPDLELSLFDLPAVTRIAAEALKRAGLADRASVFSGDFLADPLPRGADLITLIRILHDHDDAGALRLLRAARAALPADGALLVAEPMSAAPRPDRVADVYFAFYLLAMGRGRARSPNELFALLRSAGFRRTRLLRTRSPLLLRAILATP